MRGDVNGDCVCDVLDAFTVGTLVAGWPSAPALESFTAWQRQQMDPNFNFLDAEPAPCPLGGAAPCPTGADFQYLLRAAARKLPSFVEIADSLGEVVAAPW